MKKLLLLAFLVSSLPLFAQDFQYNANFVYARADKGVVIPANVRISSWALSWTVQGPLSSCTMSVDTSPDGVTWTNGALFSASPCTTSSRTATQCAACPTVALTGPYYVRINVTALKGDSTTNSNVGLNVTLNGWSGAF